MTSLPNDLTQASAAAADRRRAQRVLYDLSVVFGRRDLVGEFLGRYAAETEREAAPRAYAGKRW